MIKQGLALARLTLAQALLSYQGRFSIMNPFGYITSKIGFNFFLMIFFIFLGKFAGFADPLYIVIGNILLLPAANGMCGLTLAIGEERQWGTLSYVLGSPAPRGPVFTGRATFFILDGFVTALIGFGIAAGIFHMDLSHVNFALLTGTVLILSATSSGLGYLFGSIALISRDGWTILLTFIQATYILAGVNFPVASLPVALQKVSYALPLTRGVMAARAILGGAGWGEINRLVGGEALVGVCYILAGYLIFLLIEKRSTISGTLDAI
jgi:ABC-2 type transport system permease protein